LTSARFCETYPKVSSPRTAPALRDSMLATCLLVLALTVGPWCADSAGLKESCPLGDELSLLQVRGHQKSPENGTSCTFEKVVGYMHHKCGTVMNWEVAPVVNSFLQTAGCPQSKYEVRWAAAAGLDPTTVQAAKCFINFVRDPFEQTVSAYKYHLTQSGDSEAAVKKRTISECVDAVPPPYEEFPDGFLYPGDGKYDQAHEFWQLCRMVESHPVMVQGQVPKMLQNDTFQSYLRRVDVKTGLLVQAMWNEYVTWTAMGPLHDLAAASSCASSVCLPSFDTQPTCLATWESLWQTTAGVEGALLSGMVNASAACCPNGVIGSVSDSRHNADAVEERNEEFVMELPSKPEMVKMIIELDSTFLNGTASALAAKLGCPFSADYNPEV